ncbi:hypothetical protein [Pararobbsia silviterrae]|uniref:hypothetical protein n=1 Tax=Pararobbsia silviterrae TaxID=1792498 RepID=UPI0013140031|nr:hypothetical protein [Pararobbsia silviterrae]
MAEALLEAGKNPFVALRKTRAEVKRDRFTLSAFRSTWCTIRPSRLRSQIGTNDRIEL